MNNHDSILFPPYRESFKEEILRTEPLWWKHDKGIFQYIVVWNAALIYALKKCKTYRDESHNNRRLGVMYMRFGRWVMLNNLPLETIRYAREYYSDEEFRTAQYIHIIEQTLSAFNDITGGCFTSESIKHCINIAIQAISSGTIDGISATYNQKLITDNDRDIIKLLLWAEISHRYPDKTLSDTSEEDVIEAAMVYMYKKEYFRKNGYISQFNARVLENNVFIACMNLCPDFTLASVKKLKSYYDRLSSMQDIALFMLAKFQSKECSLLTYDLAIKPLKEAFWKKIEAQLTNIQSVTRSFPTQEEVMKAAIVVGWEECLTTRMQMKISGVIADSDKITSLQSKERHIFRETARALAAEYPTCSRHIREAEDELVRALENPNYVMGLIGSYHGAINEQIIGRRNQPSPHLV